MKVILITVGNFQEYIIYNIQNLLLFQNTDITVITERDFFPLLTPFADKIECIDCKTLGDEFHFNDTSRLDKTFRNGFWHLCSLRLFFLYSYIQKNNISDCIHIENDVLVYENLDTLPFRDDAIENNKETIYAPFDTYNRVIPSIIYIPNAVSLEPILRNYNHRLNDMENLALYNESIIRSFPIFPQLTEYEEPTKFNRYYKQFHSIFDAAAIGQYIGGIDPRNDPRDTRGFINETCIIKYNECKFYWLKKGELYKPFLYIENTNTFVPIINLHIHSKRLQDFMGNSPVENPYIRII